MINVTIAFLFLLSAVECSLLPHQLANNSTSLSKAADCPAPSVEQVNNDLMIYYYPLDDVELNVSSFPFVIPRLPPLRLLEERMVSCYMIWG